LRTAVIGRNSADDSRAWLREFFPGYFALVMATGIVAVAARLLHHGPVSCVLFWIALVAYAVL